MAAKKKTAAAPPKRRPEPVVAIAPPVRVWTTWTPQKLRTAEIMAEGGNLSQAVAICEWLLTDDRVPAVLDARIDALLGLEPSFDEGIGRRKKKAMKALEAGEDFWESYPESELRLMLRWGLLLGGSLSRHHWTLRPDHGGRILPMPKFWHPQTLRWDWTLRKLTVRDSEGNELDVVPGDGQWILHAPEGFSRFWANGLWRSLSRWVLAKQLSIGDRARISGRGSQTVVECAEGSTDDDRKALADYIQNSAHDAVFALAYGFDVKLLQNGGGGGSKDMYDAQIRAADEAIAIRVRGGNLTTQVTQGGSRAAAETQSQGDDNKTASDANALSTTLNSQSLNWWAELNFGDPRLAPWPVWPVEPEEDKTQRATMVSTLGDGLKKMTDLGFSIDPKAVKEEFGLSFLGDYQEPQPLDLTGGGDPNKANNDPASNAPASDNAGTQKGQQTGKAQMLATKSGIPVMATSGFAEGQAYVDDVVDGAAAKAGKGLSPLVKGLLEDVSAATSYDDLRQRVIVRYGDAASPEQVRDVLLKAMVLADMAGAAAVRQDADSAG